MKKQTDFPSVKGKPRAADTYRGTRRNAARKMKLLAAWRANTGSHYVNPN